MKSTNPSFIHPRHLKNAQALQRANAAAKAAHSVAPTVATASTPITPPVIRTTAREYVNPVDYQHPFDSLSRFAQSLALRYDAHRTRHAYYRQLRLLQEHFATDPATLRRPTARLLPLHQTQETVAAQIHPPDPGRHPDVFPRSTRPPRLRSIRYYGFCHPAAKASRLRVQLHSGRSVQLGAPVALPPITPPAPCCPRCGRPTRLLLILRAAYNKRGPPTTVRGPPSDHAPAVSWLNA